MKLNWKMCFVITWVLFLTSLEEVIGQSCSSTPPEWSTGGGNILLNGNQVFHLKGTAWFGMETETHAPHGLWTWSVNKFLNILRNDIGINALRLPFSVDLILNNYPDTNVACGTNPSICNLPSLDLMEHIIDKAGEQGILVMLDQHRLYGNSIHELWYENPNYSEGRILQSWEILLNRFATKWNVFALDLKNEPHGQASWGLNNRATDWNKAAERIIRHIGTKYPEYKGLFFVEGVGANADTPTPNNFAHFWGGNMEGVHRHPISTGNAALDRRVVYSPHTYGPDVFNQKYFQARNFPDNMPHIWSLHFGFVEGLTGHPIVTGEWGGRYRPRTVDRRWADAFAKYLVDNCMSDNFYWCLNPNSGDTGGLLQDDWTTLRSDKVALLNKVQPNPSRLTKNGNQYCFWSGSAAKPSCNGGISPEPQTQSPPPQESTEPSQPPGDGGFTVDARIEEQWSDAGAKISKIKIIVKNGGSKVLCDEEGALKIRLISPRSLEIRQVWIMVQHRDDATLFSLPNWIKWNLRPGQSYDEIGMIVKSEVPPRFVVESAKFC